MNGLDTSMIVTYLKPNDARLGALAADVIDSEADFAIGLVTLAEAGYVLAHHFAVPRTAIVDALLPSFKSATHTSWVRRRHWWPTPCRVAGIRGESVVPMP